MTTTRPRNDIAARCAIFALLALALWANVYHIERPASAQADPQDIILTATPALPTPALAAPLVDLAQSTPIPDALAVAPAELPAPVWPADAAPAMAIAPPIELPVPDTGAYLAVVGAQAEHSPRGDVAPLDAAQTGPMLMPAVGDTPAYIVVPQGAEMAPGAIASSVPPISADQAAILAQRESNTCPSGMVFYPRTGCHLEGSGGPMPGAVGESR